MKIGVFTDVHANLPAMEKALEVFQQHQCETIYHLGDLIGIGPYPRECMDRVMDQSNIECVMGNHDYWFAFGLPDRNTSRMSDDEREHQGWTHSQLSEEHKQIISNWPFEIDFLIGQFRIHFAHYALNQNRNWFKSFLKETSADSLDVLFEGTDANLICYGHQHIASDFTGNSRYLNLGSAGCFDQPVVRLAIIEEVEAEIHITKEAHPYEDGKLMEEFDLRQVPARDFIRQTFIRRTSTQ